MNIYTTEDVSLFEMKPIKLDFLAGLNMLAGQNGTYKTKLLESLFNQKGEKRVYGFSPKRNALAQELKEALQQIDTQQKTKESLLTQFQRSSRILPTGFTEYPSFSELFVIRAKEIYDNLDTTKTKKIAFEDVADDFNKMISSIFSDIKIKVVDSNGRGDILIEKNGQQFSVSQLSTGEREVISLILNLEYLKDSYDIFLIDEPEVHLNWSLEKFLFEYLNNFSEKNNKQIIVATHSRVVFEKEFAGKTNFLSVESGVLHVNKNPDIDMVNALAGEAVQFIESFLLDWKSATQITFFVEDETHRMTLESLFDNCHIIECGDKSRVIAMIKLLNKMSSDPKDKYFGVVDSDNEENEQIENLITLSKYAIENFFLNTDVLSKILSCEKKQIQENINSFLKKAQGKVGVFRKIAEIEENEEYLDLFHDAKGLLDELCNFNWKSDKEKRKEFIKQYVTLTRVTFDELTSRITSQE